MNQSNNNYSNDNKTNNYKTNNKQQKRTERQSSQWERCPICQAGWRLTAAESGRPDRHRSGESHTAARWTFAGRSWAHGGQGQPRPSSRRRPLLAVRSVDTSCWRERTLRDTFPACLHMEKSEEGEEEGEEEEESVFPRKINIEKKKAHHFETYQQVTLILFKHNW